MSLQLPSPTTADDVVKLLGLDKEKYKNYMEEHPLTPLKEVTESLTSTLDGFSNDMRQLNELINSSGISTKDKIDLLDKLRDINNLKDDIRKFCLETTPSIQDLRDALEDYKKEANAKIIEDFPSIRTEINRRLEELSRRCTKVIHELEVTTVIIKDKKKNFIERIWDAIMNVLNRSRLRLLNFSLITVSLILCGIAVSSVVWPVAIVVGATGLLSLIYQTYREYKSMSKNYDEQIKAFNNLIIKVNEILDQVNELKSHMDRLQFELVNVRLGNLDKDNGKRAIEDCDIVLKSIRRLYEMSNIEIIRFEFR